jgi:hypothetical protein
VRNKPFGHRDINYLWLKEFDNPHRNDPDWRTNFPEHLSDRETGYERLPEVLFAKSQMTSLRTERDQPISQPRPGDTISRIYGGCFYTLIRAPCQEPLIETGDDRHRVLSTAHINLTRVTSSTRNQYSDANYSRADGLRTFFLTRSIVGHSLRS